MGTIRLDGATRAMALLEAGIPISLLMDLATLDISLSRDINRVERADVAWVHSAA